MALTAYGRPDDQVRALEAECQRHLTKPVTPSVLAALIASLVRAAGPVQV